MDWNNCLFQNVSSELINNKKKDRINRSMKDCVLVTIKRNINGKYKRAKSEIKHHSLNW